MRAFLLFNIILTVVSETIQSQVDSTFLSILDSTIRNYQRINTVYYADKLDDKIINSSIKAFSKSKIVSQYKIPTIDSIILTKNEISFIKQSLRRHKSFYWPDSLIKDSRRIRSDTLVPFVIRLDRHALDSVKQLKEVSEQNKYLASQYKSFVFSRPIFLREKSIFLIFFLWYNGHGGSHELSFFRKDGNTWKKWIVFNKGWW